MAPLFELDIRTNATLNLIPSDRLDQPLLIRQIVELVCNGRQIELQLLSNELANLRVVVVPVEPVGIRSVRDQVDVDGTMAECRPFDHRPASERLAEVDLDRRLLQLFGDRNLRCAWERYVSRPREHYNWLERTWHREYRTA